MLDLHEVLDHDLELVREGDQVDQEDLQFKLNYNHIEFTNNPSYLPPLVVGLVLLVVLAYVVGPVRGLALLVMAEIHHPLVAYYHSSQV